MAELKPQLGVKPSWVAIPDRIKELAEAIIRCRNDTDGEILAEWAYEIMLLSNVSAVMSEFRKEQYEQLDR